MEDLNSSRWKYLARASALAGLCSQVRDFPRATILCEDALLQALSEIRSWDAPPVEEEPRAPAPSAAGRPRSMSAGDLPQDAASSPDPMTPPRRHVPCMTDCWGSDSSDSGGSYIIY